MRLFSTLVLVLAIGALSSPVRAEVLFSDDFEGHTTGDLLSSYTPPGGVGASWTGALTTWDATTSPPVVAASGTGFTGCLDANTDVGRATISSTNTTAVTEEVVQFQFDVKVFSRYQGVEAISVMSGFSGRAFDLLINADGSIQYYNEDVVENGGIVTAGAAGSVVTSTWVPVNVVANYGAHTFHATVGTYEFDGAWGASGGDSFQSLYLGGTAGGANFAIDNLSIQTVPEPSSLAMIGMALIGLLACAWRKRKLLM